MSIVAAEARGETIVGREITIETSAGCTRIDILAQKADGALKAIESKNGPTAGLTAKQKLAFPMLESEGGIPRGANAVRAGLTPGEPIGPLEVHIDWWNK